MGNWIDTYFINPGGSPLMDTKPTFDPNFGFPNGRKPRVMVATEQEMESVKLPLVDRDFCAHVLIDYQKCRKEKWPWVYQCHHQKHAFLDCEHDDFILRMKEFEREKRLLRRQQRIDAKLNRENLAA